MVSFLSILNYQQNDIKFTIQKANKTLNFLVVEIELNESGEDLINTWVWRKSTNTRFLLLQTIFLVWIFRNAYTVYIRLLLINNLDKDDNYTKILT